MTALEPGYVSSLCWYMWLDFGFFVVMRCSFSLVISMLQSFSDFTRKQSPRWFQIRCLDQYFRFVMMSSHSLIGLVQSFFTKSDVEAEDPMMAMKLALHGWSWYDGKKIKPVCTLVTLVTVVT